MDAHFDFPEEPGAYWFWCEQRQAFRVCDVIRARGRPRALFTDGTYQQFCGPKGYFVGPIPVPVIGAGGTISDGQQPDSREAAPQNTEEN